LSPDGQTLASAGGDCDGPNPTPGEVKLWDVGTGRQRAALQGHTDGLAAVGFSPDGQTLASAGGYFMKPGEIKLWDVRTGQERATLQGHTSGVTSLCFSATGRTLASGRFDTT